MAPPGRKPITGALATHYDGCGVKNFNGTNPKPITLTPNPNLTRRIKDNKIKEEANLSPSGLTRTLVVETFVCFVAQAKKET